MEYSKETIIAELAIRGLRGLEAFVDGAWGERAEFICDRTDLDDIVDVWADAFFANL